MSVKNPVFSDRELAVLKGVERWRLIASGLPKETLPARRCAHLDWMRDNTEAHPHREALIVLSGRGHQGHCGKSYPVGPGTVLLFDSMEPHDCRYPPDHARAKHLCFLFLHDHCDIGLSRIAGGQAQAGLKATCWQSYPLTSLGLSSSDALFPGKACAAPAEVVRRRCIAAVDFLVRAVVERSYDPAALIRNEKLPSSVVDAMLRHIYDSRGKDCRLATLAHIAGYSRWYFSRLFRQRVGMSLRGYVNETRIHAMRQMLAEAKPLRAIAADLGFTHPSALSRWRRQQGV